MGDVPEEKSELDLPTGARYMVWTQFTARFTFKGIQTVLVLFLFEHLRLSENLCTELVHIFLIVFNFAPVVGAVLSDGYLGSYRALLYCSFLQLVGSVILVLGAARDVETGNMILLVSVTSIGLLFIAVGGGGARPTNAAFGGDQIEMLIPKTADRDRLRSLFFSLFYMAMSTGSFLATIAIPQLRMFGSYKLIFSVQTAMLGVCILLVLLGTKHYAHREVKENIIVKVGKIITDAVRFGMSKGVSGGGAEGRLQETFLLTDGVLDSGQKKISRGLHWLDGAKTKHDAPVVEDVKLLFRVLTLFIAMPVFWALFEQQYTSWVFQARSLNCKLSWLGGLVLQPEQMQALNPLLVLVMIPVLDKFIYPLCSRLKIQLPPLRKMALGMACGSLAFLASGVLQLAIEYYYREFTPQIPSTADAKVGWKHSVPEGPVATETLLTLLSLPTMMGDHQVAAAPAKLSVLWLLPQYFFISLGEVLVNVTGFEFAYALAPSSMKNVLQSAWYCTSAFGDLITFVIVATIGEKMTKANEFFFFAGGCTAATMLMIWISYRYDVRPSIQPSTDPENPVVPEEEVIAEVTHE